VSAAHAAGRLCGGFIALGPDDVMFFHCAGGLLQVASFKIIMNHSHSAIFNNENAAGIIALPGRGFTTRSTSQAPQLL
jgi:hypothetical protein